MPQPQAAARPRGRHNLRLLHVLAVASWIVLGLIVAPIFGLAPPPLVAIIIYAVMLAAILGYVLFVGRWEKAFVRTLSWPITWSLLAVGFAYTTYHLILFQ